MATEWREGPAQRLDRMVAATGLSNTQLGRELGYDDSAIHRWRTGERTPKADQLANLLARIDASADAVLGLRPPGIDPPTRHALDAALQAAAQFLSVAPPREDTK